MAKKINYKPSKRRVKLSPGDVVRIYRELLELSQNDLSDKTGLSQAVISGIECGNITLGADRAKVLGRALHVNPGLILFPQWEDEVTNASKVA